MRYQVIVTETLEERELLKLLQNAPNALTIFYFLPEGAFFYIACSNKARILTPHFRRFYREENPLKKVLSNLPHGSARFIRRKDFLYLFRGLRSLHKKDHRISRLFIKGEEILYWQISEKERVKVWSVKKLKEVLWEKLLDLEANFLNLQKSGLSHYEDIWLSLKKELLDIRHPPDFIYFADFYLGASLSLGLQWNDKSVLVPYKRLPFFAEVVWPKIEKVLVLTNILGEPLPQILQNADFWTKGMRGFFWRHIYGELTVERLLPFFSQKERYDLIIYRGHSQLRDGKIYLPLGNYAMEKLPTKFYLHLSCTDYSIQKKFNLFPARWNFLPAFRLLDFDDKTFLENFLKLWKKSNQRREIMSYFNKTPFLTVFA